jgi:hypothetical protein
MDDDDLDLISRLHQRHCTVNRNGCLLGGKQLQLRPEWSIYDLLCAAEERLGLTATPRRLFNSDGMEITDLMMIGDDAVLFVSGGGDFVPPRSQDDHAGAAEVDGLPTLVGGFKVHKARFYFHLIVLAVPRKDRLLYAVLIRDTELQRCKVCWAQCAC